MSARSDALTMIREDGQTVTLQRLARSPGGQQVPFEARPRAFKRVERRADATGLQGQDVVKFRIAGADPALVGWPVPPAQHDRIIFDGHPYHVDAVDPVYEGDQLVMYVLEVSG